MVKIDHVRPALESKFRSTTASTALCTLSSFWILTTFGFVSSIKFVLIKRALSLSCLRFNKLKPSQMASILQDTHWNYLWISSKISLQFVPKGPIDNMSTQIRIAAFHRTATNHYLKQRLPTSLTRFCVTQHRWHIIKHMNWNPVNNCDAFCDCIVTTELLSL